MGPTNEENKRRNKNNKKTKEKKDVATIAAKNNNHGSKVITDDRFSSVHSDPRFQIVRKHQSKVPIDSRFDRMFSDKSFSSSSAPLDKRGKSKNQNSENPLRHYYRLEEEKEKSKKNVGRSNDDDEESEEIEGVELAKHNHEESDSETNSESEPLKLKDESDSDTSTSISTTDIEDEDSSEEEPSVQEENVPVIEKETCRLAVVNMDWSHVKASDLYIVLNSFVPRGGQILSVAVYPSEFGTKRMEEEAVHGPVALFHSDEEQSDDGSSDEIDTEKLRSYEKSRLRYYYAVVECDSVATADYLYKACDGVEFERSSNVLDLRFIPDSMEFKHPPRDVATEAPTNYKGLDFHTRALQQSNIHLSWDEDEPHRAKTLTRKFNDDQLAELELKEFLASDEGETDNDEADDEIKEKPNKRDMYRALVQSGDGSDIDGDDNDKDMEVTFNTGLEDISKRILEKKDKKSETVWEAYLRKKSEKKKAKKKSSKHSSEDESSDTDQEAHEQPDDFFVEEPLMEHNKKEGRGKNDRKEKRDKGIDYKEEATKEELELLLADDQGADRGARGYNLKHKKVKGKKGKEVLVDDKLPVIDHDDPRFSSLFTSPLYALDPTDPQYKRSAAYARQLVHKQHKTREEMVEKEDIKQPTQLQLPSDDTVQKKLDGASSRKEKHEISSLVRSIKRKAQKVQYPFSGNKASRKDETLQFNDLPKKKVKHELSELVQSVKKNSRSIQR